VHDEEDEDDDSSYLLPGDHSKVVAGPDAVASADPAAVDPDDVVPDLA